MAWGRSSCRARGGQSIGSGPAGGVQALSSTGFVGALVRWFVGSLVRAFMEARRNKRHMQKDESAVHVDTDGSFTIAR